jgi:hypothetical protein
MKKIPSLFKRDYDGTRLVYDAVVEGCEWVATGEGVATRKYDGTACMVRDGKLYRRYDAKAGRTPPLNFIPAEEAPDPVTGHWPGWVPVGDRPEDRWHREAYNLSDEPDGTYELVGPRVQDNPEGYAVHVLIRHGVERLPDAPRDFDGLRAYLAEHDIEGIVWWRDLSDPNCDKVKIKAKDFAIKRIRREG